MNLEHYDILKQGVDVWNSWRKERINIVPDLQEANLTQANLAGANLQRANLHGAKLFLTDLTGANLQEANLNGAILLNSILKEVNFTNTDLRMANLMMANLRKAKLNSAQLHSANLLGADLTQSDLTGANLTGTSMIHTNLDRVCLNDCRVYGINVWDIRGKISEQKNLIITQEGESIVTVDDIKVAQFIYLILNNIHIRNVITSVGKKGVLILGRFTPERKRVLDTIKKKLQEHDFLPIMFDFQGAKSKDFIETIKVLAGLSRFVIADITNPSSIPLELQATIPNYMLPFIPIIQKGEQSFSMFLNLQNKYDWVLDLLKYDSEIDLIKVFQKGIIDRALEKEKELLLRKAQNQIRSIETKDY